MQDHSQMDTKPIQKPKRQSLNKLFLLTLLIGILMGMVITVAVGYGLYVFEYFDLIVILTVVIVIVGYFLWKRRKNQEA